MNICEANLKDFTIIFFYDVFFDYLNLRKINNMDFKIHQSFSILLIKYLLKCYYKSNVY